MVLSRPLSAFITLTSASTSSRMHVLVPSLTSVPHELALCEDVPETVGIFSMKQSIERSRSVKILASSTSTCAEDSASAMLLRDQVRLHVVPAYQFRHMRSARADDPACMHLRKPAYSHDAYFSSVASA